MVLNIQMTHAHLESKPREGEARCIISVVLHGPRPPST